MINDKDSSKKEESKKEESLHEQVKQTNSSQSIITPIAPRQQVYDPKNSVIDHEKSLDSLLKEALYLFKDIITCVKNNHYKLQRSKNLDQFKSIVTSFKGTFFLVADLVEITRHKDTGIEDFQKFQRSLMLMISAVSKLQKDDNFKEVMTVFRTQLEKLVSINSILSHYYKIDEKPDSLYQIAEQMRNEGFAHQDLELVKKYEPILAQANVELNLSELRKIMFNGSIYGLIKHTSYCNEQDQKIQNAIKKLWDYEFLKNIPAIDGFTEMVKLIDIIYKYPLMLTLQKFGYTIKNHTARYSLVESFVKTIDYCLSGLKDSLFHYENLIQAIEVSIKDIESTFSKFQYLQNAISQYDAKAIENLVNEIASLANQEQEDDEVQDDVPQEVVGELHTEAFDV
jgi:hypothetical protein